MCGRHVCLMAVILALAGSVAAQDWDLEIPSTSRPPEIDGHMDSLWAIASVQYITVPINGTPDSPENCSGSWRVMWDSEYLYAIIDVNDSDLVNDSGSAYLDDSVEFYFDGGNSKGPGSPLSEDDRQYTFGWSADDIQGTNTATAGVEHAQVDTATGWRIEMRFPWLSLQAEAPQMGDLIGIDCFINDDDGGGDTREHQLSTFANDSGDWEHPSDWGTAVLVRGSREKASGPNPADGATDVPRDIVLGWVAGEFANTHDVYLGTDLAAVTDAGRSNPLGVLASQDQVGTSFDSPDLLEYGQTYYWRVDEVNSPPGEFIYGGDVWSFTVEPALYPITNIVATSPLPNGEGSGDPQVTVDGTGLTNGQHSVQDAAMWLGDASGGGPAWIQFDFDRLYKVYQMQVWNFNGLYEGFLGFGCKDVTIEYATEPDVWISLGDFQLEKATSKTAYTGQSIDVGGLAMRAVRVNIASNFSGRTSYGLSEVQFLHKPVFAREPEPAHGTVEVDRAAVLSWRSGREAASHQVQFGTDEAAVVSGAAPADTVATNAYQPAALNLGTCYYWRVDEVNEAETPTAWSSDVWSFTIQEYVSIDNFESYTDDEGYRIYETWLDGYGVTANGSQIGHDNPPYAEKSIVHSGRQAMPLYYENTQGVANSEATLALSPSQDWTANGADTFSLYYRGRPTGFAQISDNNILMSGIGDDIWGTTDQFRFVYKQLTGNGSIVARVDRLDNTNEWAKAGVMIRETLESDSVLVDGVFSADLRACMQWRSDRAVDMGSPDATSHTVPGSFTLPHWVKLMRNGDAFKVQHSADGVTWSDIVPETANDPTSVTVAMPSTVYIGLAVCSHNTAAAAGAEFSEVATTGSVSGAWQSASIGADQPVGNAVDGFYLTVQDSSGGSMTLTNTNPYAVTVNDWQQWMIPLSDLSAAGVDASSIAWLTLGIGDRNAPSQNASGLLYIDDIAFGHPIAAED